jgi:hypothetical protein
MVRSTIVAIVAIALLAVAGYAGWRLVERRDQQVCWACQRPVHAASATTARVDGREETFCCPACALSEHEQSGRTVTITSLTDYGTAKPLSPGHAFLVRGSDVHTCAHDQAIRSEYERPLQVTFDRCWPSLVAFDTRERAVVFARQHGGEVVSFTSLETQLR